MAGVKGRSGGPRANSGGPRANSGGARPGAGRPASEKTLFLRAFVGPLKPKKKKRLTEEERKEAERQKALRNIEKRRLQKEAEAAANGTVYVKYARTKSSQNQCLLCKSVFVSALNTAKFCSQKCRSSYYNEEQSKRDKQKTLEKKMQPITCLCCGAVFCAIYATGFRPQYCSKLCGEKMRYKKLKSENHISLFKTQMRVMVCNALAKKGYNKGTRTEKILGCSFDFLKQHIERQFLDGMSWDNREEWHIDHIIPMASATTQEEAMALNHFTNLRPLWAADNLLKNDKVLTLL